MNKKIFDANFLEDIKDHKLTIIENTENAKVFKMSRVDSSTYHFYVSYVANKCFYTGDMGTYCLGHLEDAYQFFVDWKGAILYGYLEEKLLSSDVSRGHRRYDAEHAKNQIGQMVESHYDDAEEIKPRELLLDIREIDFDCEIAVQDFLRGQDYKCLEDWWELGFSVQTHSYQWAIQAIIYTTKLVGGK